MALWFVLGLMAVIAAFAVLWPLGRGHVRAAIGHESEIYRDQLAEIERDRGLGLIGPREAEAARIEVSRRLIAAVETGEGGAYATRLGMRRAVALAALVLMPLLSGALYLRYGSPGAAERPMLSREAASPEAASLETLVQRVEQHLEKNPQDGRGWEVLAPVLLRLGRADDAVRAFRNTLAYNGETAARHSNLGEALAAAANGVITAEAKAEFERARALDAMDVKARYFLGLAAQQDGRKDEAAALWRDLLKAAPSNAVWRRAVEAALASLDEKIAPVLSDEQTAAGRSLNTEQQGAFIQSMIDRLASRLKQNGNDPDGWLRLIRAYLVLGDKEKAQLAVSDAQAAIAGDAALQTFNEQLKGLGIGSESGMVR